MSCSSSDKWISAVSAGLLFVVLSSPLAYDLTGSVCESLGLTICKRGCPNIAGLGVHAVIYALLVRAILAFRGACYSVTDKLTISLMAGLMFFILSSPQLYKLESDILEKVSTKMELSDIRGCPNVSGLVANGVLFSLLSRLLIF